MIEFEIVTAPTGDVIPLAEVKSHLRVDQTFDDAIIGGYMAAAAAHCGQVLAWRTFQPTTYKASFDYWDGQEVYLPYPPLLAVASIAVVDESDLPFDVVTIDPDTWVLDKALGRVRFFGDGVNGGGAAGRLTVTYTAGYATLPVWARQAILLLTGHYYENRESVVVGAGVTAMAIPQAVEDICLAHRAWRPGGAI
jgi:uncharacterized phiE125 gp8 family phage protein